MRYVVLVLFLINIVAFVMQFAIPGFTDAFLLQSSDILTRPYILITSMFLHGDLTHLVFNMFALLFFGLILESVIGSKKFLKMYLIGGVLAGLASSYFYPSALGASGAIFVVIGCLAVLRARMVVWAMGVPMPMFVAAALWAIIDLVGLFVPSNVANIAHLAGLAAGIVYGFYLRKEYGEEPKKKKGRILNEDELDEWEDKYMR